jgi:hypothetical protein
VIVLAAAVVLGLMRPRVLMGALIGVLAVYAYHHLLLPAPPQSRSDIGALFVQDAISIVLTTPIQHVVWTFGPFWWCVSRAWPLDWRWLAAAVLAFVLGTATLDFTRVFVLVALPAIIVVIDRIVSSLNAADDQPRWLTALPAFAFVQSHLLSLFTYDSRMPEVISRVTGFLTIHH